RLTETVALARKAGQAVTGFEKTRARLAAGGAAALVTARDAAADGRGKLARMVPELPEIAVLEAAELGLAFGRDFAIHAALDAGGIADRALAEARRLSGFRAPPAFLSEDEGRQPAPTGADEGLSDADERQQGARRGPGRGD
ncbi:MAG: hypothetical protein AAF074_26215, partial [Pseudomonadota bacterium]